MNEPKLKWKRPKKSIESGRCWYNAKINNDFKLTIAFGCVWNFSCKELNVFQTMEYVVYATDKIEKVQYEAEQLFKKILSNKLIDYKKILNKLK